MADRRTHRIAAEIARSEGFEVLRVEPGGAHSRIVLAIGDREFFHVLGHRAERRGLMKFRADLRRMKRQFEATRQ